MPVNLAFRVERTMITLVSTTYHICTYFIHIKTNDQTNDQVGHPTLPSHKLEFHAELLSRRIEWRLCWSS